MPSSIKLFFLSSLFCASTVFLVDELYYTLIGSKFVHTNIPESIKNENFDPKPFFENRTSVTQFLYDTFVELMKVEKPGLIVNRSIFKHMTIPVDTNLCKSRIFEGYSKMNMICFRAINTSLKTNESEVLEWTNQPIWSEEIPTENFEIKLTNHLLNSKILFIKLQSSLSVLERNSIFANWYPLSVDSFSGRVINYDFNNLFLVVQIRRGYINKAGDTIYRYSLRTYTIHLAGQINFYKEYPLNITKPAESLILADKKIIYSLKDDLYAFRSFRVPFLYGTNNDYLQKDIIGPRRKTRKVYTTFKRVLMHNCGMFQSPKYYMIHFFSDHQKHFFEVNLISRGLNSTWEVASITSSKINYAFKAEFSPDKLKNFVYVQSKNKRYLVVLISEYIVYVTDMCREKQKVVLKELEGGTRYSKVAISNNGKTIVLLHSNRKWIDIYKRKVDIKKGSGNDKEEISLKLELEDNIPDKFSNLEIMEIDVLHSDELAAPSNSIPKNYIGDILIVYFEKGIVSLIAITASEDYIGRVLKQMKVFQKWNVLAATAIILTFYLFKYCFRIVRVSAQPVVRNSIRNRPIFVRDQVNAASSNIAREGSDS